MQVGAQPNVGQKNLVPKLARPKAMSLAVSAETIRPVVKRGHSQDIRDFGKLLVAKTTVGDYWSRTHLDGVRRAERPRKDPECQ